MSLIVVPQTIPVPLFDDGQGGYRVGKTRVYLEDVVRKFEAGETPEGIVHSFDTLTLSDVYVVVAYYLTHRQEVAAYIQKCERDCEEVRREVEARQGQSTIDREELLRRRAALKETHAAPGD